MPRRQDKLSRNEILKILMNRGWLVLFIVLAGCAHVSATPDLVCRSNLPLRTISPDEVLQGKLTVSNQSDTTYHVVEIGSSCGCAVPRVESNVVSPHSDLEIPFVLTASNKHGEQVVKMVLKCRSEHQEVVLEHKMRFEVTEAIRTLPSRVVANIMSSEELPFRRSLTLLRGKYEGEMEELELYEDFPYLELETREVDKNTRTLDLIITEKVPQNTVFAYILVKDKDQTILKRLYFSIHRITPIAAQPDVLFHDPATPAESGAINFQIAGDQANLDSSQVLGFYPDELGQYISFAFAGNKVQYHFQRPIPSHLLPGYVMIRIEGDVYSLPIMSIKSSAQNAR
ncbi:MAG: DUF1573 domain-containing protein [Verrucomicrobiota bacterium]